MSNSPLHRDFTFTEWSALSFENKREVWNHFWDPYEPDKGKSTRQAIIGAFCKTYITIASSALEIGYGYFGFYVGCIYVVINSSTKVPRQFSAVLINKGSIINKISDSTFHVKWRDVGGEDNNFKLNKRETFQHHNAPDQLQPSASAVR